MYTALLIILILMSLFLVIFVLMQSDKGGGLAGTFGGIGGGGLPFSGREAANILTKLTTGLAVGFMIICIVLNILSRNRAHTSVNSALQKRAEKLNAIQSQSASSVLDQGQALPGQAAPVAPPTQGSASGAPQQLIPEQDNPPKPAAPAKSESNKVNIPGVTQDKK